MKFPNLRVVGPPQIDVRRRWVDADQLIDRYLSHVSGGAGSNRFAVWVGLNSGAGGATGGATGATAGGTTGGAAGAG